MNVLIVYCHPSPQSYTGHVLRHLLGALRADNHAVELSDLYGMGFCSDLSAAEYQREGVAEPRPPVAADVAEEQRKIARADCLLFLYPVWWSDCPAKLKGWFDRVYSAGYAHGPGRRMQPLPLGVVVCTAGHPIAHLEQTGLAHSMRTVMLEDRLGQRFARKEMVILGGTLALEQVRAEQLP